MKTIIRHSMDLAIRLIDTVTGQAVVTNDVVILRNGVVTHPMKKEGGNLILWDIGKIDFTLEVSVYGYEHIVIPVKYSKLPPHLPRLDLHLIPKKEYGDMFSHLVLEGTLAGISSIDAVNLNDRSCLIRSFDAKQQEISIFNQHKLELLRTNYALVNTDIGEYEPFVVKKQVSHELYQIDKVFVTSFKSYFPIAGQIFGSVNNGQYRIYLPDNGGEAKWIVRYICFEKQMFKTIDFHDVKQVYL